MAGREPARYQAFLVTHPDGALTQVRLALADSPLATVTGCLGCRQPEQVRLTSRLAMWTAGGGQHHLPCNLLAAGLARRHGQQHRCYHGSVLLSGMGTDGGPAGLSLDQMLGLHTQISDVADCL
jgi:hypothetical protein